MFSLFCFYNRWLYYVDTVHAEAAKNKIWSGVSKHNYISGSQHVATTNRYNGSYIKIESETNKKQ